MVHHAIAADTQLHSVFAQTGYALHNIVDAFQFAAQSHLILGNKEVEMTIMNLVDRQTCLCITFRNDIRLQGKTGTLLPAPHKGRLLILRQGSMRIKTHKELLIHGHRIITQIFVWNRILQLHPFKSPSSRRILGIRFQMLLQRNTRQGVSLHQSIDRQSTIHYRPFALFPLHRSQIGFSTKVMIRTAIVAVCKEYHPPTTIASLYKIAMTRTLNLHQLSQFAAVGQYRIIGITLVWSFNIPASSDGKTMCQFGSTF